MNKYLIAALYVMAGCAVAVPLKGQGNPEPLNGERCRLIITNTVKIVSTYLNDERTDQTTSVFSAEFSCFPEISVCAVNFFFDESECPKMGALCLASHRIRAPGEF